MWTIALNPGFPLIFGALLVLAVPASWRAGAMALSAAAAMWLLLSSDFGAGGAFAQIGLDVVLRQLNERNRIYGVGFLILAILLALYSSARRNRFEDAAVLLMAGSAVTALFVGDIISLVAAVSLSGLAAAWVVLAAGAAGSPAAGVRLLIWHGLEGLFLLFGVAFRLSLGRAESGIDRLSPLELDGAFFFAALMIRVCAPAAHVWLKDAIANASSVGSLALALYPQVLGVYALAQLFPAEPLLLYVGVAMILLGAFYALAEDDLRRAAAYAQIAQLGICVILVGIGSNALAAAAAHAFAVILAFALVHMAIGGVVLRLGAARLSAMEGLGRAMPATCILLVLGGLAAAGAPGLAAYGSHAAALDNAGVWDLRGFWTLMAAVPPLLFIALALRPALAMFRTAPKRRPFLEAKFPMLLASALAAFFCIAIGLSPSWLYRLTSTELGLAPYAPERLGPALEAIAASGCAFILWRTFGLSPSAAPGRLLDLDALYRGPMAGAGRWFGIVLLRLHGGTRKASARLGAAVTKRLSQWSRACDRPYIDQSSGAAQLAVICTVLAIILLARLF